MEVVAVEPDQASEKSFLNPVEVLVRDDGQFQPVFLGIEGLDVKRADAAEWRVLHLRDELGEVQVAALAPGVQEQLGDQDVLSLGCRWSLVASPCSSLQRRRQRSP